MSVVTYQSGGAHSGPRAEARFCAGCVQRGESVERVRDLIAMTPTQFLELKKVAGARVAIDARAHRAAILQEFEKLLRRKRGEKAKTRLAC